ncbi:hypothetical protein CBR_g26254 [Chara braunii]|uniref:Uncharacterized protein n=1 Tax=Chara braunii TaxID=69332 RepID=A0A388L7D0_CHABU|nr:hypothetical protein CBR_g26254 [Chara braunii]|eukprot:GBG78220.1 hypothetical protein CBR_g26254 [Chara braunii]
MMNLLNCRDVATWRQHVIAESPLSEPRGVRGQQQPAITTTIPGSQGIIGLAFFQPRTTSEDEAIALEEEEEEDEEGSEGEDETPEEGSYNEHNEGEQSDDEEEEGDKEKENEVEEEEYDWETLGEEAEGAEDAEAVRKREEIAASKQQLEYASEADLPISNDPVAPCMLRVRDHGVIR